MILTETKREIQTEGLNDLKQMRLVQSEEVEAHIVKVLTENYRFSWASSIREAVSNHLDSHIENGNPEHPILIKLYKNSVGNYIYESEDQGLGLDLEGFDKYYMGVGQSSKKGVANLLGKHGCGSKAWLSAVDSYTVITRKNGKEWQFLVFKGEKFPERAIIEEKDTDLPNGVIIKVNIPYWDRQDVELAIKEQTCYFKTCFYQIESKPELNINRIFENDLFIFSEIYPNSEMHISFGPCHYGIEWKSLGISRINVPVGIKISIDSGIDVHFNRESLIYDNKCKQIIKEKIKQVSEWFVNKYNEDVKEFDSLFQAWEHINNDNRYVKIHNQEFKINDLEQYSSVKFNNIKVKDINHIPLNRFKSNIEKLLLNYKVVADLNYNGNFRLERAHTYIGRCIKDKTLLIDTNISGWFKEYLKSLNFKVFVKYSKNRFEDLKYFKQLLHLKDYPKQEWRNIIKEWQQQQKEFISEIFTDGTNPHLSKEFLEWKEENKSKPKYRNYVSKKLNKQKGDITVHYVKSIYTRNEYTFEKVTHPISKIHQLKHKFLVFTEEEKKTAKEFHKQLSNFNRYRCVFISKGEIKKLPKTKQFIMFAKIKNETRDLKLFSKIATAAMYSKELQKFNNITYNITDTVIESISDNLTNNIGVLKTYINKWKGDYNGDLRALVEKALETNDIDLTYDAEFQSIKKFNEQFSFLQFLKCDRWNKDEFIKELNKQLLMRRLHSPEQYGDLFEICLLEPKPVEVLEESVI